MNFEFKDFGFYLIDLSSRQQYVAAEIATDYLT